MGMENMEEKYQDSQDSREMIKWIKGRILPRGPLRSIIKECREWRSRNWDVRVRHVYREQNEVADFMAKAAAWGSDRWKELKDPLLGSERLLSEDRAGVHSSRLISRERTTF